MTALSSTFKSNVCFKHADVDSRTSSKKCLSLPLSKASWTLSIHCSRPISTLVRAASSDEATGAVENAASAAGDSVVPEVAALPEADNTAGVAPKKASPLGTGGTLSGSAKEGKDPSAAALGKKSWYFNTDVGFADPRWKNGTWDIAEFTEDGKTDWNAVIDAEVIRRKWLEENPQSSTNDAPVLFDTSIVPWWAWVKRFHLPEAEKLNGRAAMIGYAMGYLVDSASGVGLVDQTGSFFGKLLLFLSVLGVLFIRETRDIQNIKDLSSEWTFYDKQWQATWKEGPPRGGSDKFEK